MKKLYMNLQDFNSHAHVERDNFWGMERLNRNNFNSHAHVERDRPNTKRFLRLQISTHTLTWSVTIYAVMKCIYVQDFNSHAHVERDPAPNQNSSPATQFQLTRSRGAWLMFSMFLKVCNLFQLTRSRGAWLADCISQKIFIHISTHTLTWSVTINLSRIYKSWQISTHTLTWSVTTVLPRVSEYIWFQLTRSRGAWLLFPDYLKTIQQISTHTLTWSVTVDNF